MTTILYYFHDPMCSWCYAFRPVWKEIKAGLPTDLPVQSILGGLAPDSTVAMPEEMKMRIQGYWRRIEQIVPGTVFNYGFWTECVPVRSTYPACRAVIAAAKQSSGYADLMVEAIQDAYYQQARNPSLYETHLQLASELRMNTDKYKEDLSSADTNGELQRQIQLTSEMGVTGFPSLVLQTASGNIPIHHHYSSAAPALQQINSIMKD